MSETLDQLHRSLQNIQTLGLDKKVAVLERLQECLAQGTTGSTKAVEGIFAILAPILGSSQVIACQAALACIQPLVELITRDSNLQATKALLHFILPQLLDRLGDGRLAVRALTLETLTSMWLELNSMQSRKSSLDQPPSPTRSSSSSYSMLGSSLPKFTTPFKSRITKPRVPSSPLSQWNAAATFERDVQTQGFEHKIWRVREMALEWLHCCVEEHPHFPASHYINCAFALLDDSQEAVRFSSKRALNMIYHSRPELQGDIIARVRVLEHQRPTLMSAITDPKGELTTMAASPYGGMRSGSRLGNVHISRPGSRLSSSRMDSRVPPPLPSQPVPPLPPPSQFSANGAFRTSNYRSMSQQGLRPGSSIGNTGSLSPVRPGQQHNQHNQQQPYHNLSLQHGLMGPSSVGANAGSYSPSYPYSTPSPPPMQTPNATSAATNRCPSSMLNPRRPLRRQPSLAQLSEDFVPCPNVPADVKVHNVFSKQGLSSEFTLNAGFFAGRESEDNWVQRERATALYRGIVWGNAAIEFHEDLVANLKEHLHEMLKAVSSLRTSMSLCAMRLCEDIAMRLGPHAAAMFDPISDALLKQCSQTKRIGAQKAAKSLEVVFQHFPLRAKAVDSLRQRMSDKSAVLRSVMVTTCISILASHEKNLESSDRRTVEIMTTMGEIVKLGVTDAQPAVRESSRELFWELHNVSEIHGKKLLSSFPDSTRTMLLRDKAKYAREDQSNHPRNIIQDDRPISAAAVLRTPSNSSARQSGMRPSFNSMRGSPTPNPMISLASGRGPQRLPASARPSFSSDADEAMDTPSRPDLRQPMVLDERGIPKMVDQIGVADKNTDGSNDVQMDEGEDEDDSFVFAGPSIQSHQYVRRRVHGLRTPVQARMSLGLIDFNQVDMGTSLLEMDTPPRDSLITANLDAGTSAGVDAGASADSGTGTSANMDMDMGMDMDMDIETDTDDARTIVAAGETDVAAEVVGRITPVGQAARDSQFDNQEAAQTTAQMSVVGLMDQNVVPLSFIQALTAAPNTGHASSQYSTPRPARTPAVDFMRMDEHGNEMHSTDMAEHVASRQSSDSGSAATAHGHFLTPERTPLMTPSPQNEYRNPSAALIAAYANQTATPRTQTARYWYGPVDPVMSVAMPRPTVAQSPMPAETPLRLNKIDMYLKRLTENCDVDESIFRSLARFAKEGSGNSWVGTEAGGSGYLDRVLRACLGWLQNPTETRNTVFVKDSCFDVLRVLVHRKSQYFTLDTARLLLLEVVRNRFVDSTILSGTAEDAYYDMTTQLDADLCFELAEDFFQRAPLPSLAQDNSVSRSGYAVCLEPQVQTLPSMDPMGVFKMDNALAVVFEFVAEVVKRLSSPEMINTQELDKFIPYSTACVNHPRNQVRNAALAPIAAVHKKLGGADTELEELLLRADARQLAVSTNPLAKYIGQIHRPEMRRLVWIYCSKSQDK